MLKIEIPNHLFEPLAGRRRAKADHAVRGCSQALFINSMTALVTSAILLVCLCPLFALYPLYVKRYASRVLRTHMPHTTTENTSTWNEPTRKKKHCTETSRI